MYGWEGVSMDSKLTLRLDKNIIEEIKIFALKHKQSLSSLTEDLYKKTILSNENNGSRIESPIARKYKGILGSENIDVAEQRLEYLKEKHLK